MYTLDQLYEFGNTVFSETGSQCLKVILGKQRRKGRKLTSIKVPPSAMWSVRHFCVPSVPQILLSANSCYPFPMESKGGGKIGDHNLPDALYTSYTCKGSVETSNSLKECTTCYTLHTTYVNMRRQMENISALKVRNTRLLRGLECELKQHKSVSADAPLSTCVRKQELLSLCFSDLIFTTLLCTLRICKSQDELYHTNHHSPSLQRKTGDKVQIVVT